MSFVSLKPSMFPEGNITLRRSLVESEKKCVLNGEKGLSAFFVDPEEKVNRALKRRSAGGFGICREQFLK